MRHAVLLAFLLVLFLPSQGASQGVLPKPPGGGAQAQCGQGCGGGLQVTPDKQPITTVAGEETEVTYFVANNGTTGKTVTLTCYVAGVANACTPLPASMYLDAESAADAQVLFNTALVADTGSVRLRATATGLTADEGSYKVTTVVPGVEFVNHSGDNWDRSSCLTVGLGEAAAQCGDLLVTHATPTVRTKERDRGITMVYTSRQGAPSVAAVARVTADPSRPAPTSVTVRLKVNGVVRATGTWTGWTGAREVALTVVDSTLTTGVHDLTLEAENQFPGQVVTWSASSRIGVVNRVASPFGRGWWMAGLEQLVLGQPTGQGSNGILWVGGDGSARLFVPAGTDTWLAPAGAFRDTLLYDAVSQRYTRRLRHGARVAFDATGRHVRTFNRVGDSTVFTYTGSLLTALRVPTNTTTAPEFALAYTSGRLVSITTPGNRVSQVGMTNGRITGITDPDGKLTTFGYDGLGRMISRAPRSTGFTSTYQYANGLRVTQASVPYDTLGVQFAVTSLTQWDELGRPGTTPTTLSSRYTTVDGPRTDLSDVTKFWVGRFGAVTSIQRADGATTMVGFGDPQHPALATSVRHPNGAVDSATFNSRGNLLSTRMITEALPAPEGLPDLVMSYAYADTNNPDAPSRVEDGFGRGTTYSYNTLGLTKQVTDARGLVTVFKYQMSGTMVGLLDSITVSGDKVYQQSTGTEVTLAERTGFAYDGLGNLIRVRDPAGSISSMARDAVGRVTDTWNPFGYREQRTWDVWNRVTEHRRYRDPSAHPGGINPLADCRADHVVCLDSARVTQADFPASVATTYEYGPFGVELVEDPRGVIRAYEYGASGWVVREIDEAGLAQVAEYNPAGQVLSVDLRGFSTVRYGYDVLGRRTKMAFDALTQMGVGTPLPPGLTTGATIPGDSVWHQYDIMGRVTASGNRHGTIWRTYFGTGALRTQSSNVGVGDSLAFAYDATGARTAMWHVRLPGGTVDQSEYFYNTAGDLSSLRVTWGGIAGSRTFGFWWDKHGRRDSVAYPTQASSAGVGFTYDILGTLRRVKSVRPGTPTSGDDYLDVTLTRPGVDAIGRILEEETLCGSDDTGSTCGGSHSHRVQSRYYSLGWVAEQVVEGSIRKMRYDASGNLRWKQNDQGVGVDSFYMAPASNRLVQHIMLDSESVLEYAYTSIGGRAWEYQEGGGSADRGFYYDGLGRSAGVASWVFVGPNPSPSNMPDACRYDADGQLAMPCDNLAPWLRFDGNNVVTASGTGRWHFVHGPALDDPVIGLNRRPNGTTLELYFVTDGNGRQIAVGKGNGNFSVEEQGQESQNLGWHHAGASSNSGTFDVSRMAAGGAPGLSFFRNRLYDQASGRWTQEDPIGVAGGVNLYQYAGNNPVALTDPFGLCPPEDANDGPWCNRALKGSLLERSISSGVRGFNRTKGAYQYSQSAQFNSNKVADIALRVTVWVIGTLGFELPPRPVILDPTPPPGPTSPPPPGPDPDPDGVIVIAPGPAPGPAPTPAPTPTPTPSPPGS